MIRRATLLLAVLAGGTLAGRHGAAAQALDVAPSLELVECEVAGAAARCGTLAVPEDRDTPGGRTVEIRVVVLPAMASPARPDPLLVLEGGPGASVVEGAAIHVQTFASLRRERDLVLIEQRGTAPSHPLACDTDPGAFLQPVAVADCLASIPSDVDPRSYTTSVAVRDLVDAIDALDVERVNVFGVSYGTRTALHFARRHPDRVRTVSLLGTYPPGRNAILDAPAIFDRAIELTRAACAADAPCAAAYPGLGEDIGRVREGWDAGTLAASRADIAATLRLMMFYPLTARLVPGTLHRTASGEADPIGAPRGALSQTFGGISPGAFLSILCSEDAARIDADDVRAAADGTLFGADWGLSVLAACEAWPAGRVDPDFHDPFPGGVPVLSLTGELDPSMPPTWGEALAERGGGIRHLTLPQAPHGLLGMQGVGCVVRLLVEFVESGDPFAPDATCLAGLRRPPFATP